MSMKVGWELASCCIHATLEIRKLRPGELTCLDPTAKIFKHQLEPKGILGFPVTNV